MTTIQRLRVDWSGFIGAPGVSTFYATDAATLVAPLRAFFAAINTLFPTDVLIQVEGSGDEIEDTTGALVGAWSGSTPAGVPGTSSGSYSAVSGALVRWGTAAYLSGRRLKGHTFLVPISGSMYGVDGAIGTAEVAAVTGAAAALVSTSAGNMLIWQRPRASTIDWTDQLGNFHHGHTPRGGGFGSVTTGVCSPSVTELRSRRD